MNRRNKRVILFLLVVLHLGVAIAQKLTDKIPYTLFDDFETGELYSWEPYPYSQDIGFDALYFARKSPTYHNSNYALARPVKASDAIELYQGFTKRLNLYTTTATRVKAAVYFQSDRNPQTLELSLGTFDGRRYLHTIQNPVANQWVELDIPITDFQMNGQSLSPGEHIQVVTVKASYPMVYYLYTYTILMDNFSINGERQRHFVGVKPASMDFNMFDISILKKHFFYGDVLSLTTRPEEKTQLQQVKGKLMDSHGRVVRNNISFSKRGEEWTNESIHRFTERDVAGQWEILLTGQTEAGTELQWGFRFLMPGKHITGHPRLFFSAAELQKRLANEKSPVAKGILDKALKDTDFMKVDLEAITEGDDKTGDNITGGPYSKNEMGLNAYEMWFNPMESLGSVIREGSFRYAFIHDTAAGEKAKKALLKLCSFSKWNCNWMLERKFWTYYPVGYTLTPIAYGYDMIYDLLSVEDRKLVREAIINKGLKLFYRDMVEMNRMPSNMTNHIAVIVTGHGLAATAIYGDDPDNSYLEPFLSGIMTKAKTFIDRTYYKDGSYGEPIGYMDMATRDIVKLLATLERNFGVDYSTTTNAENFYKYPLQSTYSNGLIQCYGDDGRHYGHGNYFTQEHAQWFVKRTGNPFLYSYVKPFWETGNGGYLGYLWYRDDIKPVSRTTLPVSKVFGAQGMVMRSGWDDASTVITTRVGPNSNHKHYDQGSFQVMTNNTELLTDPGIGFLGYYANLDYVIYNIQAIAHNVLLVDYDPESQVPADYDNGITALREWPRMAQSFACKIADACEADLTIVYKNKLKSYNRTLLYTKSGPLFLFDQLKSSSEGHVFNWLFHAPQNEHQRAISYSDQRVMIDRPAARLTLDVIEPEIASAVIRDRNDEGFPESFVSLSSKPNLTDVNFFAVILPEAKPVAGDSNTRLKTTRIDAEGWIGARLENQGNVYFGFFRTGSTASDSVEGFTTDAKHFTVSLEGNGRPIQTIYFEGTSFTGKGLTINSTTPITCALAFHKASTDIEVQADKVTELSFPFENIPKNVLLDGIILRNWHYDPKSKMVSLKLPEGRHDISIN